MNNDYAYAKFQGLNGEFFYIQNLPTKICKKPKKDREELGNKTNDCWFINDLNTNSAPRYYGLLNYDCICNQFYIIPFSKIYIDNQLYYGGESPEEIIAEYQKNNNTEKYDKNKIFLQNCSSVYFPIESIEIPLIYYFILPKKEAKSDHTTIKIDSIFTPSKLTSGSKAKIPDKTLSAKWSLDDKEQLKKFILTYGYGRWKQVQLASKQIGGKLSEKPVSELRGFANAFVRCIIENLSYEKNELRKFLINIIEEYPEDPYILANPKDWDFNLIRQRANPWAKRIQLLYRVTMLIKKFKQEQKKNPNFKTSKDIQWENLLNFLPNSVFYGQRPSVWWTKKHDVDLLRGTYKHGYANYQTMRNSPEYSFSELEKTNNYSEFPNADTITRRLKKLIQTIVRFEQNDGKLDFEIVGSNLGENELEGWTSEEKKKFYLFLLEYGVPLNNEGRSDWQGLKEKFQSYINQEGFDRGVAQIEKFVHKIRIKCQQVIEDYLIKKEKEEQNPIVIETVDELSDLNINYEEAQKFNKNTNMLHFIRKSILANGAILFKNGVAELAKKSSELKSGEPGSIPNKYNPEKDDLTLLQAVGENGFMILNNISENPNYGFEDIKMSYDEAIQRLDFVCEFFKNLIDRTSTKKRKSDKPLKDMVQKKQKFILNTDEEGNIVFPLRINNSLTLLNCGVININPAYHSEHNLFPVGYKSVRVHASTQFRGAKADYTCEILEGPDNKPLYKVTSSEDPEHPIIRDSSTGCWVYICQKVNDIAEVKKQKVTISGTERFGLLEPNVARILEHLPNAEKCLKYNFKYRIVNKDLDMMDYN